MLRSLVLSLILTWLLELAFAFLLGIRRGKDLLLILLVNLITNRPSFTWLLTFRYSRLHGFWFRCWKVWQSEWKHCITAVMR